MKITRIEATPFAIPYRKPLLFASGEVRVAEHVLVRVHTDEGLVGTAEAPPRPFTYGETQASIIGVIDSLFEPALQGCSPLDREQIHARLDKTVANPTAKGAIDMAVWDLIGQSLGVSVTELLGGWSDRMKVSHMLGFADPTQMADEAERVCESYGIVTFKVKVGRRPVELDVAVCRAIRERLGDKIELYIDGNRGWTPSESLRALRMMDDLDLLMAEELCPSDDVLGRRWLVERCSIPFVADESAPTPAAATRELLGGSATMLSIKTARTGFTVSQQILNASTALGVEVVMGNQIDGQIGSLCSAAFGAAFRRTSQRAGELSNFLDMSDDLLVAPLQIRDGELLVRQAPGLGIEIDEHKLDHYRQDN